MSKGFVFIENGLVKYEDYSRLIDKCEKALKDNRTKGKEINRLNNTIKELEKWLEEEIKSTKEIIKVCDDEEDRGIYLDKVYNYKDVLEKLKELKESDKE